MMSAQQPAGRPGLLHRGGSLARTSVEVIEVASSTQQIRGGRGHRAYRRARDALANRFRRNGWPCPECGVPFDWERPQSSEGFTADHPNALNNGGRLTGQKLAPMCRGCNARKGDIPTPVLTPATLPPEEHAS